MQLFPGKRQKAFHGIHIIRIVPVLLQNKPRATLKRRLDRAAYCAEGGFRPNFPEICDCIRKCRSIIALRIFRKRREHERTVLPGCCNEQCAVIFGNADPFPLPPHKKICKRIFRALQAPWLGVAFHKRLHLNVNRLKLHKYPFLICAALREFHGYFTQFCHRMQLRSVPVSYCAYRARRRRSFFHLLWL